MVADAEMITPGAKKGDRRSLSVVILTIFLLCSAFLNIILARKIKDLNYGILYLKSELKTSHGLNPGDNAPPIQAKDVEGNPITISLPGSSHPSIIYIFTPTCMWCARNLDNIKTLFTQTRTNYRFFGLSLSSSGLKEYVSQHKLDFPIYTDLAGESALVYRSGTPRTLIVAPDGKVLKSWFGAYTGDTQREVEAYFKTNLPGVVESDPKEAAKDNGEGKICD